MKQKDFLMNLYKICRAFNDIELKTKYEIDETQDSPSALDVITMSGKKLRAWPTRKEEERIWLSFQKNNKVFVGYKGSYLYDSSRQITFNVNNCKKNTYTEYVTDGLYGKSRKKTYEAKDLVDMIIYNMNWPDMQKAIELNGSYNYYIDSEVFNEEVGKSPEVWADAVMKKQTITEQSKLNLGIPTSLTMETEKKIVWLEK